VAFGTPAEVMQPGLLLPTFGGHASVQPAEQGKVVVYDTCCDGGEPDEVQGKTRGARAGV
jgi:hypothetical protein